MSVGTKNLVKVIALLCLVALIMCTGYLVIESDHECTGEECEICGLLSHLLARTKELLSGVGSLVLSGMAAQSLLTAVCLLIVLIAAETPVRDRIRIDC